MKELLVKYNFRVILGLTVLVALILLIIGITEGITSQTLLIASLILGTLLISSQILRHSIISNSIPKLDVSIKKAEEIEVENNAVTFVSLELGVKNEGMGVALIRDYKFESELLSDVKDRYFEKVRDSERGQISKPGVSNKNTPTQISYGESDIVRIAINGFEYFGSYKILWLQIYPGN
ncbi:hypothetical protein G3570_09415 [Balneolaceae bacterium YR4-1]|uniref:Uncharacterized protein n=1 Tax=Halalkalibaculum roseum TaxID=2709311 RepID=A0A6M1SV58_9BACT|nr:hypothetical protein [Halalkalibaculum roseum]NGP76850.1 hypothetical protein [Halalkalibaculum roseum]